MKVQRTQNKGAEVYTASLNDIMFFLMLFFLIIATMATPMALRVALPRSSTAEQTVPKKRIVLSVTHDKRYYLDDREVGFEQIEPELARLCEGIPDGQRPDVTLEADMALDLQSVVQLIDIGNRQHLNMVLFAQKDR